MFEIFVPFGRCLCCLLPLFVNRHHVRIQIHAACCCFTRCTTETRGSQRARSSGATWVQVTREKSPSTAKRPRTAGLRQHAYTHQLIKQRNVDLTTDGLRASLKKAVEMTMMIQNKRDSTVQCIVRVHRSICSPLLKNVTSYPPPPPQTHTFLKWPFLTDFKNSAKTHKVGSL